MADPQTPVDRIKASLQRLPNAQRNTALLAIVTAYVEAAGYRETMRIVFDSLGMTEADTIDALTAKAEQKAQGG